jgi:hypothetical protein
MCPEPAGGQPRPMTRYLLHHRHTQDECGVVFASFKDTRAHFAIRRRWPPAAPVDTQDLVDDRRRQRRGRAAAAAVLRGRAHQHHASQRGSDPMNSGVQLLDGFGLAMFAGLPPGDRRREPTMQILPDRSRGVVLPSSARAARRRRRGRRPVPSAGPKAVSTTSETSLEGVVPGEREGCFINGAFRG